MRLKSADNLPRFLEFRRFHDYALAGRGIEGVLLSDPLDYRFFEPNLMSFRPFHHIYNITKITANASYFFIRSQNANTGHH